MERKLNRLAKKTGRTKSYYVKKALREQLDDPADASSSDEVQASVDAGKSILSRSEIKRQVETVLQDRGAVAYLFGSYARGEATPRSDVDLLVILESPPPGVDYRREAADLRRKISIDKSVDLVVMDQSTYDDWKDEFGSVQYEVAREGVRLV